MARTVKQLLSTVETEIFKNWNDLPNSEVKAINITLCNLSGSSVNVWLSFCVISGFFSAGLVLSQTAIAAYETITIEVTDRIILTDESVRAFASVANVVSLSIDLVGNIDEDDGAVPVSSVP